MPDAPTCAVAECLHDTAAHDRLTLPDGQTVLIPWCDQHLVDPVRDMVSLAVERREFLPCKSILLVDDLP